MNAQLAANILGINRTRAGDLAPMVRALSIHAWNNTDEEKARLGAARWAIANWRAYQQECNARRDALFKIRRPS